MQQIPSSTTPQLVLVLNNNYKCDLYKPIESHLKWNEIIGICKLFTMKLSANGPL